MILAHELRIGNLVTAHFQTTRFNSKVEAISLSHGIKFVSVYCDENLEGYSEQNISAIPLTPEILEKCGFNVTSKGFYQHGSWYNISLKYMRGTYALRCNFMDIVANNIDYVHQLQNLHFALTQTELQITL